jgi:Flp pilus assembly pilin Flp
MFDRFNAWVGSLIKTDSGQTFVEYALVLSVIVVGILLLTVWTGLGDGITAAIDDVAANLTP